MKRCTKQTYYTENGSYVTWFDMQSKFKHVPIEINFLFTLLNQMSGLLDALQHKYVYIRCMEMCESLTPIKMHEIMARQRYEMRNFIKFTKWTLFSYSNFQLNFFFFFRCISSQTRKCTMRANSNT